MTIPACYDDYRALAKRRLPKVLFDYVDGGANSETALRRSTEAMQQIRMRQRVMRDVSEISLSTEILGQPLSMPLILGPIGMCGMLARRGEVQAARAAQNAGVAACLSTLSICGVEEVCAAVEKPPWFQLYMIKDRGYMRELLSRARGRAAPVLMFTVDLQVPGSRYRDARNGLSGGLSPWDKLMRGVDGLTHPDWLWDVMLNGRPHSFGNLAAAMPKARGASDFWVYVKQSFDPTMTWADLAWVRDQWPGPILVKGVMDLDDARDAVAAGADGVVVSNHGGRQLDGTPATIEVLPAIAAELGHKTTVMVDGGVRSGLDILRALALGAQGVVLGRAWAMPLAARGQAGVEHMLATLRAELHTAMALTGCTDVKKADRSVLA
jgi:L-lactate dehydrogenase (cytochrome)